jgi:glucuronate isomerase
MLRYRRAVTETAGFYNTTGFVDDTRAFASIPARHDLARRIDAGYLASLVAEGYLDLDEATQTAVDLAYEIPRQAYARRTPPSV